MWFLTQALLLLTWDVLAIRCATSTSSTAPPPLRQQIQNLLSVPSIGTSSEVQSLLSALNRSAQGLDQLSASISNISESGSSTHACSALSLLFVESQSEYLNASSAIYANITQENWSQTCWLAPTCICLPRSAAAVSAAVKIFTYFNTTFAVRGAGHNSNPRFGSVGSNGVLLDMSSMRGIELSSDKSTVKVMPGHSWIDVYTEMSKNGLGVIGTKEPGPGVIGSMLGGGDPFFPGLYGMAVDNVVDFELVLANSSVIHANGTSQPLLFKSLKGGGTNFGVVSTMTLNTLPLNETWWTFREYNTTDLVPLLKAFESYQVLAESDPYANLVFTLASPVIVVGFLYAKHVSSIPAVFTAFSEANITIESTLFAPTNGSLADLSMIVGELDSPIQANRATFALSTKATSEVYIALANVYTKYVALLPSSASLVLSYQPVGSKLTLPQGHATDNILGVQPIMQQWSAGLVQWTDTAQSDQVMSLLQSFQLEAGAAAANATEGGQLGFLFQNDAGAFQNVLASYGKANLEILQAAAAAFDPEGVFQTMQAGGFLVSKIS